MRSQLTAKGVRCLLTMAAVVGMVGHASALQTGDQKKVLVLYSTRRDAQIALIGERELPRVLDAGLAEGLDYYSEYIDRARFPDPVYQIALRDFLRQKYRDVRFNVVIAINDLALTFAATHRDDLFSDVPIVLLLEQP